MNFSTVAQAHDHVIRCPACGAPLPPADAANVVAASAAAHCPFCNASIRVEAAPPFASSFGLPSAPSTPFAAPSLASFRFTGLMIALSALPFVGVLATIGGTLSVFYRASASEASVPTVQVQPEPPVAILAPPPPALPASSSALGVAAIAPGLADEPVEIVWAGRVISSKGEAVRVGATCTLAALVLPSGTAVESKRTTLVCAGKTLYDSGVPLNGMASSFFTLDEKRAPGDAASFVYELGAEDVGMRSGRAQLMVYTPKNKLDAFREGASPFHVHVQIASSSAVRSGKPLLAETLNTAAPAPSAPAKIHAVASPTHRQAARAVRR